MSKITSSANNHFKYITFKSRVYALSVNRDYSSVFDILIKKYLKNSSSKEKLNEIMFKMDIWDGNIHSDEFIELFFDSKLWKKFIINTGTINTSSIESLRKLIDLVFCVDCNYKSTTSSIKYDTNGINCTLNIFEKKSNFSSFFTGNQIGPLISSIPISNIKDYVASPDWIALRMINNEITIHGKFDSRIDDRIYNDFMRNY